MMSSYLHYNGNSTNPDFTVASANTATSMSRKAITDSGFGHQMIISNIKLQYKSKIIQEIKQKVAETLKKLTGYNFLQK